MENFEFNQMYDEEFENLESHIRSVNKMITGKIPFDEVRFGTLWSQIMNVYGVDVGDSPLMVCGRQYGHTINDWLSYGKDYFKSAEAQVWN